MIPVQPVLIASLHCGYEGRFCGGEGRSRRWLVTGPSIVEKHIERGIICSTLYADCFNQVTRKNLAQGSTCVPAELSFSADLDDLEVKWRPITRRC